MYMAPSSHLKWLFHEKSHDPIVGNWNVIIHVWSLSHGLEYILFPFQMAISHATEYHIDFSICNVI